MSYQDFNQAESRDEVLIAQVAQRNMDAFSVLYDRYAKPIYALAYHMLGSDHAEEVLQEVFLRLWDRACQFDPQRGSLRVWLMAIARHQVYNELQRRSQDRRLLAAQKIEQLLCDAIDPAVVAEEYTWLQEKGNAALQALQNLPPEQRQVLVLAYFAGLSQSEISKYLSCPLGTVKKRIRLGLQKLRASLACQELT